MGDAARHPTERVSRNTSTGTKDNESPDRWSAAKIPLQAAQNLPSRHGDNTAVATRRRQSSVTFSPIRGLDYFGPSSPQTLEDRLDRCRARLKEVESESDDLDAKNRLLNKVNTQLRKELDNWESDCSRLRDQNEGLRQRVERTHQVDNEATRVELPDRMRRLADQVAEWVETTMGGNSIVSSLREVPSDISQLLKRALPNFSEASLPDLVPAVHAIIADQLMAAFISPWVYPTNLTKDAAHLREELEKARGANMAQIEEWRYTTNRMLYKADDEELWALSTEYRMFRVRNMRRAIRMLVRVPVATTRWKALDDIFFIALKILRTVRTQRAVYAFGLPTTGIFDSTKMVNHAAQPGRDLTGCSIAIATFPFLLMRGPLGSDNFQSEKIVSKARVMCFENARSARRSFSDGRNGASPFDNRRSSF